MWFYIKIRQNQQFAFVVMRVIVDRLVRSLIEPDVFDNSVPFDDSTPI